MKKQTLEDKLEAVLDDNVNHPAHYTYGSIEVIDVIEGLGLPYHLGNAVKYIARAGHKDPEKTTEDLQKAVWYLNRYIALLEKKQEADMKVEIPSQHRVLGRYGADAQAMVHCEELAELIQAISKMRRVRNGGQDDAEAYDNLVEEMADVLICLEQIQTMYEIPNHTIQGMIFQKCARQEARLNESA